MSSASELKPKATRQAFGEMLAELGAENKKIVVLDADLAKSTKSEMFAKKFPERFFEMGIAEANMIGTGAGFALSGFTPFICSFGAFVTGRYDQVRMSVAYAEANVKIVGTHSGIGIGDDGHSQMGLEDISLMRGLPKMTVFQPCDEFETRAIIKFAAEMQGPVYIRLTRQNLKAMHGTDYNWRFGKLDLLRKGEKILLIGTGAGVQECIQAAEGTMYSVANAHTLKPFDNEGLIELLENHDRVITVEDHYTTGGLGSAVAEAIAEAGLNKTVKLTRLGVQDRFGESGEQIELYEKFGFSASEIKKHFT